MRAIEWLRFLARVRCERPGELSAFAACATGQPPVMASAPPSAPIPFSKRRRDGSFTSCGFCCAIDLVQTQDPAQLSQIFRQGGDRPFQRITVSGGQLIVGFETVFGAVFAEDAVHFLEVGVHFRQQCAVLFLQLRAQQVDNFLRAVNVGLEVPQVGMAVAIFFTADLAGCDFFN
jgi:hypothetical protein